MLHIGNIKKVIWNKKNESLAWFLVALTQFWPTVVASKQWIVLRSKWLNWFTVSKKLRFYIESFTQSIRSNTLIHLGMNESSSLVSQWINISTDSFKNTDSFRNDRNTSTVFQRRTEGFGNIFCWWKTNSSICNNVSKIIYSTNISFLSVKAIIHVIKFLCLAHRSSMTVCWCCTPTIS